MHSIGVSVYTAGRMHRISLCMHTAGRMHSFGPPLIRLYFRVGNFNLLSLIFISEALDSAETRLLVDCL